MKAKISITVLLIILITSLISVMGQEKTDKKKQEEEVQKKKEQVSIIIDGKKVNSEKDLQKAMAEALEAEEKSLKARKDLGVLDNQAYLKEAQSLQGYKEKLDDMRNKRENWYDQSSFSVNPRVAMPFFEQGVNNVYSIYPGNKENTSLSISKTLEDVTFSTDFYYDVKDGSSNISFYVSGSLKAGELKITLKKPDKTAFQELTISPLADVNWNQQFKWDEDETEGYLGKWTISISAAKANGNYRVQVNSR
jgi:hypothetical protein